VDVNGDRNSRLLLRGRNCADKGNVNIAVGPFCDLFII